MRREKTVVPATFREKEAEHLTVLQHERLRRRRETNFNVSKPAQRATLSITAGESGEEHVETSIFTDRKGVSINLQRGEKDEFDYTLGKEIVIP